MAGRRKNNQRHIATQLWFRQTNNAGLKFFTSTFVILIIIGSGLDGILRQPHRQCGAVVGNAKHTLIC
jgi:hypothetical protein